MNAHITAFFGGFLLDLLLGDPHGLPHPVRLIGRLIAKTESYFLGECLENENKHPRIRNEKHELR